MVIYIKHTLNSWMLQAPVLMMVYLYWLYWGREVQRDGYTGKEMNKRLVILGQR